MGHVFRTNLPDVCAVFSKLNLTKVRTYLNVLSYKSNLSKTLHTEIDLQSLKPSIHKQLNWLYCIYLLYIFLYFRKLFFDIKHLTFIKMRTEETSSDSSWLHSIFEGIVCIHTQINTFSDDVKANAALIVHSMHGS